jgi:hypothetical protein
MPRYGANFVNITSKDKKKLIAFMKSKENPSDLEGILPWQGDRIR